MAMQISVIAYLRSLSIAAFAVSSLYVEPISAATIPVTQCGDSGAGSLRQSVAMAADGDTIDMGRCNVVTVSSDQIEITQDNLQIVGGDNTVPFVAHIITAGFHSRLFHHTGTGTLRLQALYLSDGRYTANFASGGCVHSEGHVELMATIVSSCEAIAEGGLDPVALGGGIHADSVSVRNSQLYNNQAIGSTSHGGGISTVGRVTLLNTYMTSNTARNGGAISSLGGATITYSTIENNAASYDNGGVESFGGSVTLNKSLLLSNTAVHRCGGLCVFGPGRTTVINSTIVGNRALYLGGGELSDDAAISNSTITGNLDAAINQCVGAIRARHLRLESTIASANLCLGRGGLPAFDIGGRPWEGYTLSGSNNLIGRSRLAMPVDTIVSSTPMLTGPRENGGPTKTMPLLRGSPATDRGNNKAGQLYDQRGPGFPRVQGQRADIGAHEGGCVCSPQ